MITISNLKEYNQRLNAILVELSKPPKVSQINDGIVDKIEGTIDNGKILKIGKGYYSTDLFYKASEGLIPSGSLTINGPGDFDVTSYASIKIPSANNTSFVPTSKNMKIELSGDIYKISSEIGGNVNATTPGWFSGQTFDSKTLNIGEIKVSTTGTERANTTAAAAVVLDPGEEVVISEGYNPNARIIRASIADAAGESVNAGVANLEITNNSTLVQIEKDSGTENLYNVKSTVYGTVTFENSGWVESSGRQVETSGVMGRVEGSTVASSNESQSGISDKRIITDSYITINKGWIPEKIQIETSRYKTIDGTWI